MKGAQKWVCLCLQPEWFILGLGDPRIVHTTISVHYN